jgi:putative ABC transport system permease protein
VGTSFNIGVSQSADAHDRAGYIFRGVRRLAPTDANDFKIVRSDSILEKLSKISGIITAVATITGLITLLGAAIGLMNIMLVSVKERTAEIGIRKAVGASAVKIRSQFLVESVAISQIGCIVGTVSGILAGNGVAILLGAAFVIPWMWILCSVVICLVVGVASGYLPAAKAAALNPVEVLGHE